MTKIEGNSFLGNEEHLRATLTNNGFTLKHYESEEAEVTHLSTENTFYIYKVGEWVQIKCIYLTPDRLTDSEVIQAILFSTSLIHFRVIGCRFALDEDGAIWLLQDYHASDMGEDKVAKWLNQFQSVIDATIDALERVLISRVAVDDDDIDAMFAVNSPPRQSLQ